MNQARLKIHSASLKGIEPEMAVVLQEAPKSFARYGVDCYLTSGVRPKDDDSLHGYGMAADFDSSVHVPESLGKQIAADLQEHLGPEFYCVWHKTKRGNWHLHVEFDPGNKGVAPYVHRV